MESTVPTTKSPIEELERYSLAVRNFAKNKEPLVFENKGKEHAAIVASAIFDHSKNCIRLYATNMNGDISNIDCYKKSLNEYVKSSGELLILLDDENAIKNNITVYNLLKNTMGNVKLKKASNEFKTEIEAISSSGSTLHFMIGDDYMSRIELDPTTHQAICSFNKREFCTPLITRFDKYFDTCDDIFKNSLNG